MGGRAIAAERSNEKPVGYDYVIVGAGSAGCVVANRLSADPKVRVLLLEAGPSDRGYRIEMPAAFAYAISSARFDWGYESEPHANLNGRRFTYPRGRALGGSSSINAMCFTRGNPHDFERWAANELPDWSYAHCLPYFRRMETHSGGGNDYRGGDGPLNVTAPDYSNPLCEVFLQACEQAGYARNPDTNGRNQEGFGRLDQTIHQGRRMSTARAYLRPAAERPNLTVQTDCTATVLQFEGTRAVGIEYRQGGVKKTARADVEVVVSTGAINTPRLLMASGIGCADQLRTHGIEVRVDLPLVGENMTDHLDVQLQQACTQPVSTTPALKLRNKALIGLRWLLFRDGPGATNHFESGGFFRARPGLDQPDIASWFIPLLVNYDGTPVGADHGFQLTAMQLQPKSRGRVRLRSANPTDPPIIESNHLDDPRDVMELREGVKRLREIVAQPAFDAYRGAEIAPGKSTTSDADIERYIRDTAKSTRHPSCTCRMGINAETSVVDNEGRVHGVGGLRVVDASVMPSIPSGAINAPTIMLAEKLADRIAGQTPLEPLHEEATHALQGSE